jgi:hypothetical protein
MIEPGGSMAETSADRWTFDGIASASDGGEPFGAGNG